MRFILDANLSLKTADYLRRHFSFDVLCLIQKDQAYLKDAEIATLAKEQKRIIITLDLDFGKLYHQAQPLPSFGVIIIRTNDQTVEHVNFLLNNFFSRAQGQNIFTRDALALAVIEDSQIRTISFE